MATSKKNKKRPLGDAIKNARLAREWDRTALAGYLRISPAYVGHLEREAPVSLSDDLFIRICKVLDLDGTSMVDLVAKQNESAHRYYKAYRTKKQKAAAAE